MASTITGLVRVRVNIGASTILELLPARPGYRACLFAFEGSYNLVLAVTSTGGAVVRWNQVAQSGISPTPILVMPIRIHGNQFPLARSSQNQNIEIATGGGASEAKGVAIVGYEVADKSP